MKLNKFLLSAIAAASLTACSDSTDVVKNDKGQWNADGTGYVSLSISMPDNVGSKGSRATNDTFVKGDDKEYVVNNATLVIFSGNDSDKEGAYTLDAAYKLPLKFQTTGTNGNQIISKATITQQINKPSKAKAKALVILNLPSGLSLNDTEHELSEVSTTGSTTSLKGKSFTYFQNLALTLNTDVTKGFTMTNAPLTNAYSTAAGLMPEETAETKRTTTTLADIKEGTIKNTPEEAAANKAADIYVERSVAKVTVKKGDRINNKIPDTEINCEVEQFALDNTNNTSFLVRNVDNNWANLVSQASSISGNQDKYRFVGFGEVEDGKGYRTYWAKDPNYDSDLTPSTTAPVFSDLGENKPLYCMENTFNVAHQTHKNTTRAVVEVLLWKDTNKGKTHYMYNNDPSTFDVTNSLDELKTNTNLLAAANKIAIVVANNKTVTALDFEDAKDKNSKVLQGYKQIKSVKFNDGTTVDASTTTPGASDIFNSIKDYFGNIAVYENGIAYYPVLIKHFGDDLTPWNTNEYGDAVNAPVSSTKIDKIYPGDTNKQDNNYLGRYGVVRNNWYELTVNNVKKLGKPGINTPDNTPDDELNSYISVSINILSWAKRSQDVDLQ